MHVIRGNANHGFRHGRANGRFPHCGRNHVIFSSNPIEAGHVPHEVAELQRKMENKIGPFFGVGGRPDQEQFLDRCTNSDPLRNDEESWTVSSSDELSEVKWHRLLIMGEKHRP